MVAKEKYNHDKNTHEKIAVLIPCYNEEASIATVIKDFRSVLPEAYIYVYDNNSTDKTVQIASSLGAHVRNETLQGKGHVIRRMFADIEADWYILIDGDATYEALAAPHLLDMARTRSLDMVNGARVTTQKNAYRPGHVLGNKVLTGIVTAIFGRRLTDMLSGYRVFSRRFVKSFPALSRGFETETELTVHALELNLPIGEIPTRYVERPPESPSKLSTYKDGVIILLTIFNLIKKERPLLFFWTIALFLSVVSVIISLPVVVDWLHTGKVERFPTAILSTGIMIISSMLFICGIIQDSITLARKEQKILCYLLNSQCSRADNFHFQER